MGLTEKIKIFSEDQAFELERENETGGERDIQYDAWGSNVCSNCTNIYKNEVNKSAQELILPAQPNRRRRVQQRMSLGLPHECSQGDMLGLWWYFGDTRRFLSMHRCTILAILPPIPSKRAQRKQPKTPGFSQYV